MSSDTSGLTSPGSIDVLQYIVPVSAATVVCNQSTTLLLLDPGGLLASLTVTLPSTPLDGQRLVIASSGIITVLTINGGTVKGALTTLALNGYARYAFSLSANAWFRTG